MLHELLRRPSPSLTFGDAVEIWIRYILGEKQHHTAQAFGVNQRVINDIIKERRYIGSHSVALAKIDPQTGVDSAQY